MLWMIEFVLNHVEKCILMDINDIVVFGSAENTRQMHTNFEIQSIMIQLVVPKTSEICKFFHEAHIAPRISRGITFENRL